MKQSTWIILVIFLALVGLMVYLDLQESPAGETADTTPTIPPEYLLRVTDGSLVSIELTSQDGRAVRLARNESGVWALEKPIETEADQASAEEAATQITALRILSRLEVDPADAGLVSPAFMLRLETSNDLEKDILIGNVTPSGSGYYAQEVDSQDILILNKTDVDALLGLLSFPPYLNTPIPTLTPTETPTEAPSPTAEAQGTGTSTP